MNLNSWDYYDLEKEMQGASVGRLLELYKRENKSFSDKCFEMVNIQSNLNEEGKRSYEKECEFLNGARLKVALKIADELTKL